MLSRYHYLKCYWPKCCEDNIECNCDFIPPYNAIFPYKKGQLDDHNFFCCNTSQERGFLYCYFTQKDYLFYSEENERRKQHYQQKFYHKTSFLYRIFKYFKLYTTSFI